MNRFINNSFKILKMNLLNNSSKLTDAVNYSKNKEQAKTRFSLFYVLAIILLIVSVTACIENRSSSNASKNTKEEVKPKLEKEVLSFCELYFLAVQAVGREKSELDYCMDILKTVKSKGYGDVINAFSIPSKDGVQYVASKLEYLGLEDPPGTFGRIPITKAFWAIYRTPLKQPELKAKLVEELDNGSKIWLIEDYQTMKQARLLVKINGEMNISNLQSFSNY